MEILPDPLALLHDREPLHLLVEPGVLDGDPGVAREHLDPLVLVGEPAVLLGEVEVADRAAADDDRDAEERVHLGWFGGKPTRRGSAIMSATRIGAVLPDDQPEGPWPRGGGPMRARSARLIPLVTNWSITPLVVDAEAAYSAPMRLRTRSTMSCSTRSTESTPAIARMASSRGRESDRRTPAPRHAHEGAATASWTRRAASSP